MRDAILEDGSPRIVLVEMQRIPIPRHGRELLAHRLGHFAFEFGPHADFKILEKVAPDLLRSV